MELSCVGKILINAITGTYKLKTMRVVGKKNQCDVIIMWIWEALQIFILSGTKNSCFLNNTHGGQNFHGLSFEAIDQPSVALLERPFN